IEDDPEAIEIGPNGISLDLLRAIYRSSSLPLYTRMRAAISALPHEVPRLGVSFLVNDADIATRLDKAIERVAAARAADMKLIDAKPEPNTPTTNENGGSDARLPPPIPDRRYRRI